MNPRFHHESRVQRESSQVLKIQFPRERNADFEIRAPGATSVPVPAEHNAIIVIIDTFQSTVLRQQRIRGVLHRPASAAVFSAGVKLQIIKIRYRGPINHARIREKKLETPLAIRRPDHSTGPGSGGSSPGSSAGPSASVGLMISASSSRSVIFFPNEGFSQKEAP